MNLVEDGSEGGSYIVGRGGVSHGPAVIDRIVGRAHQAREVEGAN